MPVRTPLHRLRRLPAAHPAPSLTPVEARAAARREEIADEVVVVVLALTALAGLLTWTRHLAPF